MGSACAPLLYARNLHTAGPCLKKRQTACKPGSVPVLAGGGWPFIWDARRRAPRATDPDGGAETRPAGPREPACHPYLVLLPVGFALPPPLPAPRCALTAPFHPCRPALRRGGGMFLWHFPWGRPRRALPGTAFSVEPGLSSPASRRRRPSGRLATLYIIAGAPPHKPATAAMRARVAASSAPSHCGGRKWRWNAAIAAPASASE